MNFYKINRDKGVIKVTDKDLKFGFREMFTYSFKITKGKYELTFVTTDAEVVSEEFAKWVNKVSDYVSKQKSRAGKERVNSQINAAQAVSQRQIDEQLKRKPKAEPIMDVENERPLPHKEINKDIDALYSPQESAPQPVQEENSKSFDNILDKSMSVPIDDKPFKSNPTIKKDTAFLNYLSGRKIDRKIDYLLLTAYYFTQYEQKPRFTLKQLNAKLMQNVAIILDNSVLQEGLNRDYIECLPDLTGVVGASEYRLTAYGEKTLLEQ